MKLWRALPWLAAIIVASVALLKGLDAGARERDYAAVIDSLKQQVAQASVKRQTDSVEVIRYIRRTQFDTTRLTDTAYVTEYVSRVDTLREKCLSCVASASLVEKTLKDERDFWQARYNAVKPSQWDIAKPYVFGALGIYVGQRVCR